MVAILDPSRNKPVLDQAALMARVQKELGIGLIQQSREIMKLKGAPTGLSPYEYLYFRLYEAHRSMPDKQRYVGDNRAYAIYLAANKMSWWDAADDKLAFQASMDGQGYAVPKLYAVAHQQRRHGGAERLSSPAAVRRWLTVAPMPLYGKPVQSSHGVGALQIDSVDAAAGLFTTDSGDTHRLDDFVAEITPYIEADGYLFQEPLRPHEDLGRMTSGRLATLRLVVLLGPEGPYLHQAVCRIPAGANRVDNFRKPGNLIANVDVSSGRLGPVTRGVGFDREVLDRHPDTDVDFASIVLPYVDDAVRLSLEASTSYPGLHVQSWDIALTDRGARALEMNPGGNFNLLQLTADAGAMTPELNDFVRWCAGLKLNSNVKASSDALKLVA